MAEFEGIVQTPNLGLYKPDYDNVADIEVLDANFDILDEAIPEKLSHYLPLAGGKMLGKIDMNKYSLETVGSIELTPPSGRVDGGYIDFHFNGSTEDNTSRIVEDKKNSLNVNGLEINRATKQVSTASQVISTNNTLAFKQTHGTSGKEILFGIGDSGDNRGIHVGKPGEASSYWLLVTTDAGHFGIRTKNNIEFTGMTDGNLRWNNKNVVLEDDTASASTFGLIRTTAVSDELNCNCTDAAITPNSLYKLADYRLSSAAYKVGDIVGVPYHNELRLRCTLAGTTASTALNTTNATAGQTINDGGCRWLVEKISQVDSVNGMTGAVTINGVPVGTVLPFAGSSTPSGYVLCNGAAVSRTTYAALFAVIGTMYGAGNGSTTFNLPNYTDKFLQGHTTAGTVRSAGLPNITGRFVQGNWDNNYTQGAFYQTGEMGGPCAHKSDNRYLGYFDASRSNSIYGNSTTVQPPAVTVRYCIKY